MRSRSATACATPDSPSVRNSCASAAASEPIRASNCSFSVARVVKRVMAPSTTTESAKAAV